MVVNEVLNQADGTVLTDTMGLVTWVADMRSGVKGTRQWSNQFTYFKDQFGSSIGVIFWNRPDVKDLKGKIVLVKSGKDGDMKVGSYNNKKQLNVAESAAVTVSEGKNTGGGQKGSYVKTSPPSSGFTSKRMGTPATAYGAAFSWAVFLVHRELSKQFTMKTVPDCFGSMVNTMMIAYGNGQLVPDASVEFHTKDTPELKDPAVDPAPKNEGQGNGADKQETQDDGPNIDPPNTPQDDDIPF